MSICKWEEWVIILRMLEAKAKGEEVSPEFLQTVSLLDKKWYVETVSRLQDIIGAVVKVQIQDALSEMKKELSDMIKQNDSNRQQDFINFERNFSVDDIARMLVKNAGFVKELSRALNENEKNVRQESEADKRQSIRGIVAQLKGYNDPAMVNEELVKSLYDSRILYRAQRNNWARLIEKEISERDETMKQSILSMVSKTNQKKVEATVEPLARLLVSMAVSPEDQEAVLSALYEDDTEKTVVSYLLKAHKREA